MQQNYHKKINMLVVLVQYSYISGLPFVTTVYISTLIFFKSHSWGGRIRKLQKIATAERQSFPLEIGMEMVMGTEVLRSG